MSARLAAGWAFPSTRRPICGLLAIVLLLAGCDLRLPGDSLWRDESSRLSPRIVQFGQPVPKGGGRYKIGAPYAIKGKRYTPREVRHYDEQGVASWYGELFHGRRTANGEIYDMEALTAAHPTLPMPSYARVTNLRNGRSLVVRVNDRGPYANDRVVDLSWAVASLLKMQGAGTAPVRVQYLGPAPLGGDDGYERAVLARQPWAGPRVAQARSPAKAMRYRQASDQSRNSVTRSRKTASVAALAPLQRHRDRSASATPPLPAAPIRNQRMADRRDARIARNGGKRLAAAAAKPARRAPDTRTAAATPAADYVSAGDFPQKPQAERLAAILTEIAPAAIEPVTVGRRAVHRVRLGPFPRSDAAQLAVARIRAAGLKDARVEAAVGG
jgi:rare lipoprotein A